MNIEWRRKNPNYDRAYYQTHKEKFREYSKNYYQTYKKRRMVKNIDTEMHS